MMTMAETPSRGIARHVAFKALARSALINLACPYLLYRLAVPHYLPGSLMPLALSGLPPMLALAYSAIKLRAVDFLGLFAAENIAVNMAALVLAHTEQGALVGRALQNVLLSALFLASLAWGKPLVLYMARQFATGNDPEAGARFDAAASDPRAVAAYRVLTIGWALGLLVKSAGSYYLATALGTDAYLIASPIWDIVSDTTLFSVSILYGRARLPAAT